MTNEAIILNESIRLMNEGLLNGSGHFVEIEEADGTKKTMELPETIHTFARWKTLGFVVRKGAKSRIKFPIWKHTSKTINTEDGETKEINQMFMREAAWFTFDQVEPIKN